MGPDPDWYKEEYKARVSEISERLERQEGFIGHSLVALGGVTAFLAAVQDLSRGWVAPVAMIVAGFFLVLAMLYLRHDLFIAYNAEYIERFIRQRAPGLPEGALSWERYVAAKRGVGAKGRWLHMVLALSRLGLVLISSFAFLSLGCYSIKAWTAKAEAGPFALLFWVLAAVYGAGLLILLRLLFVVRSEEKALTEAAQRDRAGDPDKKS